ncbi:hypothetical protein [Kitasatospora sp. NPDC002965]|uniref:hypothetical protein n=1 Tax=Kitasatospora sp. NPDC002965 TaxID=3154775 RepID=UPI0033AC5305
MSTNRRHQRRGPNSQASAHREQRQLKTDPLYYGDPPYGGYREWLRPNPATGLFEVLDSAPEDTQRWAARVRDLLMPLYRGRVPFAATYLDDRIQSGVIPLAEGDEPAMRVRPLAVADFAAAVTAQATGDGHGGRHPGEDICPQLNCHDGDHHADEHRIWVHLHHLHARGALLVDDQDRIRMTVPPQRPGEAWTFVTPGGAPGGCRDGAGAVGGAMRGLWGGEGGWAVR